MSVTQDALLSGGVLVLLSELAKATDRQVLASDTTANSEGCWSRARGFTGSRSCFVYQLKPEREHRVPVAAMANPNWYFTYASQ